MEKENSVTIVLPAAGSKNVDDNLVSQFEQGVKAILTALFNDTKIPMSIKGSPKEIRAFAEVLNKERDYMKSYVKHGLSDPATYRDRFDLKQSVNKFERLTGLQWPFY